MRHKKSWLTEKLLFIFPNLKKHDSKNNVKCKSDLRNQMILEGFAWR